jgi:hypothetical protein
MGNALEISIPRRTIKAMGNEFSFPTEYENLSKDCSEYIYGGDTPKHIGN